MQTGQNVTSSVFAGTRWRTTSLTARCIGEPDTVVIITYMYRLLYYSLYAWLACFQRRVASCKRRY